MPKKQPPAFGGSEAGTPQDAAHEHLFNQIARLLARQWVRVKGKDAKKTGRTKNPGGGKADRFDTN
jgi:hypothetical protein